MILVRFPTRLEMLKQFDAMIGERGVPIDNDALLLIIEEVKAQENARVMDTIEGYRKYLVEAGLRDANASMLWMFGGFAASSLLYLASLGRAAGLQLPLARIALRNSTGAIIHRGWKWQNIVAPTTKGAVARAGSFLIKGSRASVEWALPLFLSFTGWRRADETLHTQGLTKSVPERYRDRLLGAIGNGTIVNDSRKVTGHERTFILPVNVLAFLSGEVYRQQRFKIPDQFTYLWTNENAHILVSEADEAILIKYSNLINEKLNSDGLTNEQALGIAVLLKGLPVSDWRLVTLKEILTLLGQGVSQLYVNERKSK